ncbi:hypothetical protein EC844_13519 [Acinetobacter calcoaceticus]|uniref:FilE C-terminal domain-containing protein n=1 Tax=Acinetobacter calcoaceticus TaxID=471 RepID=A0A4R1XL04_ACICA|nr:hypothetical protein EC844_13519 [Acinetobacter calcoaceticus]
MVRRVKKLSAFQRGLCLLSALAYVSVQTPTQAQFYTIIGPDGFPMVIQDRPKAKRESQPAPIPTPKPVAKAVPNAAPEVDPQAEVKVVPPAPLRSDSTGTEIVIAENKAKNPALKQPPATVASTQSALTTGTTQKSATLAVDKHPAVLPAEKQGPVSAAEKPIRVTTVEKQPAVLAPDKQSPITAAEKPALMARPEVQASAPDAPNPSLSKIAPASANKKLPALPQIANPATSENSASSSHSPYFSELDGEQYVDHEYLEEREFNLEGKKRFYLMTDPSTPGFNRMQTIEREKGITESIIGKFRKSDQEPKQALSLSSDYFRMPQQDVIGALEQRCFSGKKISKAKILSQKNKELGLWPVAPITEKFVYEVVKLEGNVQEILLTSYATSNKNPTYYWPLVVFLDQSGCVIEGVSGFKNQQSDGRQFQYASIEGLLKKPENAAYLFMTPLSTAVDVEESKLSHQGQIKLNVIR